LFCVALTPYVDWQPNCELLAPKTLMRSQQKFQTPVVQCRQDGADDDDDGGAAAAAAAADDDDDDNDDVPPALFSHFHPFSVPKAPAARQSARDNQRSARSPPPTIVALSSRVLHRTLAILARAFYQPLVAASVAAAILASILFWPSPRVLLVLQAAAPTHVDSAPNKCAATLCAVRRSQCSMARLALHR
jgi:hypothetical protein